MARKKKPEEHENHERWLVSYADFITLLFAFFVVMYSMSSVNEGKYRVLSESVSAAFRGPTRSLQPIQIGQLSRSPKSIAPAVLQSAQPISVLPVVIGRNVVKVENQPRKEEFIVEASEQMGKIAADVESSLDSLIDSEDVTLRKSPLWLEVEINSNLLFTSASAVLSVDAEMVLSNLGIILNTYPNRINVEGFTDDRPMRSPTFPSNWELSSARAAAVVRLFEDYGVDPKRMVSVGYGEFRPLVSNDSEAGRASNRRVVVVIMANLNNQDIESLTSDIDLLRQRLSLSRLF